MTADPFPLKRRPITVHEMTFNTVAGYQTEPHSELYSNFELTPNTTQTDIGVVLDVTLRAQAFEIKMTISQLIIAPNQIIADREDISPTLKQALLRDSVTAFEQLVAAFSQVAFGEPFSSSIQID